tara:strand:- start:1768 stop:2427 length:660 start_codon:yes stop_codon:yes gene_type:complete
MATSIESLPNELTIENNNDNENITMNVQEKNRIVQPLRKNNNAVINTNNYGRDDIPIQSTNGNVASNELSKDSLTNLIRGLQDASKTGSTSLQTRDIPMMMEQITHDSSARPNFVPSASADKVNYIQDEETMETLIRQKKQQMKNKMDNFYDEIQTPLLIMVMFFVFQLPIFKKSMINNFPAFFKQSGSYNLKGLVFTTMLFGGSYYGIIKSIKYLSEI